MKSAFIELPIIGFVVIGLGACQQEYTVLKLPDRTTDKGVATVCKAPSIEKNIVGTWRFESNYNTSNVTTKGTVTFGTKGSINDPDSLFANKIDVGPVLTKTYNPTVNSSFPDHPEKLFVIYRTARQSTSAVYFTVVSNECDRIHISLLNTQNETGFILTR